MLRYAEILLNYMEAMNEYNPEDPKIITYFNEIRERAGIPNITVTYPQDLGDKEKMREWILRERQIELAKAYGIDEVFILSGHLALSLIHI